MSTLLPIEVVQAQTYVQQGGIVHPDAAGLLVVGPEGLIALQRDVELGRATLIPYFTEHPDLEILETSRDRLFARMIELVEKEWIAASRPVMHDSYSETDTVPMRPVDKAYDLLEATWTGARTKASDAALFPAALKRLRSEMLKALKKAMEVT